MHHYILGLGTNLGDKAANLQNAIALLQKHMNIEAISSVYKNKALLPTNAPISWDINYYNMAIMVKSDLAPLPLLTLLKEQELQLGRVPNSKNWAPRFIDIDILLAEGVVLDSAELQLPHPGLTKRAFALLPAAEVAPDLLHPEVQLSLAELAKLIDRSGIITVFRI